MADDLNRQVNETIGWFSKIYLGGIPSIITDDSAFLSFVCVVTGTEALSGYRYGDEALNNRFPRFIRTYFPKVYHCYADDLYEFRKKIVHAMSTGRFALTHHHSEVHLGTLGEATIILNAEDFYGAFLISAQEYFSELRHSHELKVAPTKRLANYGKKSITIMPVTILDHGREVPSGESRT